MDSKTIMEDSKDKIHGLVKEKYSGIAKGDASGCMPSCCGGSPSLVNIMDLGKALDYAEKDLSLAPGEANLGLGCGNPISRAELKPGETVLDLGSGAGFDAFLAAAACRGVWKSDRRRYDARDG